MPTPGKCGPVFFVPPTIPGVRMQTVISGLIFCPTLVTAAMPHLPLARAALAHNMGHEHLLSTSTESDSKDGESEPLDGSAFKRGKVLFLGGDLCYPGGSHWDFQYRFLEMFDGARPDAGMDRAGKSAYSIAQNHDWFDSALTFRRHFVNRSVGEFIGVQTSQKRSYFATRLRHNWWVLGLDFALVHDLDRGQYEAFRRLAGNPVGDVPLPDVTIQPGDHVILIYPEPYWTRPLRDATPHGYPKRYQRLEAILQRKGIKVRMRLAGDVHHYVRESSAPEDLSRDDMLVTCGSGGAFLHPTYAEALTRSKVKADIDNPDGITAELRDSIQICTMVSGSHCGPAYHASAPYPPKSVSRKVCWHNLLAMFKFGWNGIYPVRGSLVGGILQGNILFSLLLGLIYLVAIYANFLALSSTYSGACASVSQFDSSVHAEAAHLMTWGGDCSNMVSCIAIESFCIGHPSGFAGALSGHCPR
jgi:hypothetical protein